jgi:mono/diheme cytochrome c family protein
MGKGLFRSATAAILSLGFAICIAAQTEADHPGWMKDVAATKGKISKEIAAKQNADVAADASHLAEVFKQIGAFWAGRDASDAVALSRTAETASNDLAAAAKADDEEKVQSALRTVNGTCSACHMNHREGSPGNFKIK